ncbi:hypothetical protein ACFL09_03120 [Planctomycetota bacterium]
MGKPSISGVGWFAILVVSVSGAVGVAVLALRFGPPTQEEAEARMREAVRRSFAHYLGGFRVRHRIYVQAHPLLPESFDGMGTCDVEVVTRGEFVRRFGKPGKRPLLTVLETRYSRIPGEREWNVLISSRDVACPPDGERWHSHGSIYTFPTRFGAPDPRQFSYLQWVE